MYRASNKQPHPQRNKCSQDRRKANANQTEITSRQNKTSRQAAYWKCPAGLGQSWCLALKVSSRQTGKQHPGNLYLSFTFTKPAHENVMPQRFQRLQRSPSGYDRQSRRAKYSTQEPHLYPRQAAYSNSKLRPFPSCRANIYVRVH